MDHYRAVHPEYEKWAFRYWRRVLRLILASDAVLVLLDFLYLHRFDPISQYLVLGYLFGTLWLWIFQYVKKSRRFRDAWRETHPSI